MLKVNDYGVYKYGWFPVSYTYKNSDKTITILSPGNASTTFREQGREINEPYIIHSAEHMTKEELIVAISRGKCKEGLLFKFSNIKNLLGAFQLRSSYEWQGNCNVPARWENYKTKDTNRPTRNEYGNHILYRVEDDNNNKYVGITYYDNKKTAQENCDRRMKRHMNKNVRKDKLSPVLTMENPIIKPIYDEGYYIHGKLQTVQHVEKKHIRKTLFECMNNNTICVNKDGTKLKPKINEEALEKFNVLHNEIDTLLGKFKIETKKGRKGNIYVIHGRTFASSLGLKTDRVRRKDWSKIVDLKDKTIADMALVSISEVKERRKKIEEEKEEEKYNFVNFFKKKKN